MKRDQLIRDLSDRLAVPEHSAQVFLHAFFDAAKAALRTGDPLRIDGLGHWIPSLNDDGTLASIEYIPITAETSAPAQGPVSSIDTMHFIPAVALENLSMRQNAPVDVADVVDEVQRLFISGNGNDGEPGDSGNDTSAALDAHTPTEALQENATLPASGAEADEAREPDASTEALPADTGSADDDTVAPAVRSVEETAPSIESRTGEEDEDVPAAMSPPDPASTETDTEELDEDEDEEDNEVFYRNRDQLYHPPQERNTRPLLIVALVLTAVMIVIVLTMVFGEDERPEVPGTGESGIPVFITDGRPATA